MKYEKIANYSGTKFRRITGVKRSTFEKMVKILKEGCAEKHQRRGRHQKLSIEDLLLATLEYLLEYRTYAHIASSYDIAESNLYRGIHWVEDTLIKDGTFSLPGQKALLKSDVECEVILANERNALTETPQKTKEILFRKGGGAQIIKHDTTRKKAVIDYVKAGFIKGEQRYKCKNCGSQFVPTRRKSRGKQEKLMAVWM